MYIKIYIYLKQNDTNRDTARKAAKGLRQAEARSLELTQDAGRVALKSLSTIHCLPDTSVRSWTGSQAARIQMYHNTHPR